MIPEKPINTWSANAKLMLSGEYLVLRGARSLSIPLKFRQALTITEHPGIPALVWKTIIRSQHWFDATFSLDQFVIANTNDFPTAQILRDILMAAKKIKTEFLNSNVRYEIFTDLDFDINWGLGSSSSLIANIAACAGIEPFELFRKVSAGSGCDLATALSPAPIIYQLNGEGFQSEKVNFFPPFHENLYFAYLGKKRNSSQSVEAFNKLQNDDMTPEIREIDAITDGMLACTELREFRHLMREHENIISKLLGIPSISEKQLNDFNGDIKSLGAWGGDFIMLATDMPRDYVISWLRKRDMNTWFTYKDIALNPVNNS